MSSKVTTQVAVGSARGKFDRVSFDVTVEGHGTNGPKAKAKAQETVTRVNTGIKRLEQAGIKFDKRDLQSTFCVTQHFEYDNGGRRPAGYVATFSLHLETDQVDRASEIQDVLTSVDGANVGDPHFTLQ